MELLNQADGNVMTMLEGINEEVDDEALKEEIMRCFSNAPTIFQAIPSHEGNATETRRTSQVVHRTI